MTVTCSRLFLCAVVVTNAVFLSGCNGSKSNAPVAEMTDDEVGEATNFVAGTLEDSESLVKAIDSAVASQDAAAFQKLIDVDQLAERTLAGLDVAAKFKNEFKLGFRQGGASSQLATEIIKSVEGGGSYEFVRMVKKGKDHRPLFRLTMPEMAGFNYHELLVSKNMAGKPCIADMYVFLSGEQLSQSMRRLMLPAVAASNGGIISRLAKSDADVVKNFNTLTTINSLAVAGNFAQAYALFETLPDTLQKDKSVMLQKLLVAQNISDTSYSDVMNEFEQLFPNDPACDFLLIDMYLLKEDYASLIKSVDRLQVATGDPFVNVMKVDSLVALNRVDEARKVLNETKAKLPDNVDVFWFEITFSMGQKDFATTARLLDEGEVRFDLVYENIDSIPEYTEFLASDEGKAWRSK